MEKLNQIETIETTKSKEKVLYNPELIKAQIAKIREREAKEEPRKAKPEILDRRLEKKLSKIPNGQ